jgi:Caudovirus prohead serine protease
MRVLFDHGFDPQIGNKVLGPIDVLREEEYGPYGEVPLFDTSYNRDLLPGLREGVYGASFRFRVQEERWDDEPAASDHNPKGIPERTILRAWVGEFGPVTFPANPAATAGMRSLTDHYYDGLRQRDTSAYHAAIRAAGRPVPDLSGAMTINHAGRPVARSAGGGETPDAQPGNGQASSIRPEVRVIDVHPLQSKEYYRV